MDVIRDYIKSGRALQSKYDELRTNIIACRNVFEERYQPLIRPLREINSTLKTSATSNVAKKKENDEFENTVDSLATEYLGRRNPKDRDVTFGINVDKRDGDREVRLYLGNLPVSVEKDIITIGDFKYAGTRGLWELLTLKQPEKYDKDDLETYEHLVLSSSVYRHNNDPNGNVKSSSGKKYTKIIKPILVRHNLLRSHKKASLDQFPSLAEEFEATKVPYRRKLDDIPENDEVSGSGLKKILTNAPVEYVYWNNLGELLDRIYIVYGEIQSGNNNPNLVNELVNILQEIREI
jgi:hypothetical protein